MNKNKEKWVPLDETLEKELCDYSASLRLEAQDLERFKKELKAIPDQESARSPWWKLNRMLWGGKVFAVAMTVLIVFLILPRSPKQELQLIPKGFSLDLWAIGQTTGYQKKIKVKDGEVLYPNDQIKFTYKSSQPGYLLIASINQKGTPTIFMADRNQTSVRLSKNEGEFPVFELDDYIGLERIVVFYSAKPFRSSQVKSALTKAFQEAKGDLHQLQEIKGAWRVAWTCLIQKRIAPLH